MLLRLAGYHIYYFKQNKGKIPTITYDRLPNSKCSSITTSSITLQQMLHSSIYSTTAEV